MRGDGPVAGGDVAAVGRRGPPAGGTRRPGGHPPHADQRRPATQGAGHRRRAGWRPSRDRAAAGDQRDDRLAARFCARARPPAGRSHPGRLRPGFQSRRLRLIAERLIAALDPDGPDPADDPSPATAGRGELWLRNRRDGRLAVEGWLDAEHGTQVRALIEQLATRRPTTTDGVPDSRSIPQRQADALIELCDRARVAEGFPTTGGEPPHVTVTINWEALRTGVKL
ncbi:MAG: DUF222 domain-containing protein [Pseudonocardiales bacterium]|nr:DUF222 domain-containing protein [Pseudonocardiales bacterium]